MNAVVNIEKRAALRAVPIDQLADLWPRVSPWIASALEHGQGDENLWDVFIALARGSYSLWSDGESMAAVAQIVKHPRQSVATILYAAGSLDACYRAFQFAQQYCKANGIDVLRVWGRPGWKRVLGLESIGEIMQVAVR